MVEPEGGAGASIGWIETLSAVVPVVSWNASAWAIELGLWRALGREAGDQRGDGLGHGLGVVVRRRRAGLFAGRVQVAVWLRDHHAVVQRHADGRRDLDGEREEPAPDDGKPAEAAVVREDGGSRTPAHGLSVNTISADCTRGLNGAWSAATNSARSTRVPGVTGMSCSSP